MTSERNLKPVRIKRIIGFLLLAVSLFSLAACSKSDEEKIPDGMQVASVAGAEYRLFVPTTWNLNTDYGVSGAYYSLIDQSNVSLIAYPKTEELLNRIDPDGQAESLLDAFWKNQCLAVIEETGANTFRIESKDESDTLLLGDANAHRYLTKTTVKEIDLMILQVVAERAGKFYVFSFVATESMYERLTPDVEKILEEFRFSDTPYTPEKTMKEIPEDAKTPEGMQRASTKQSGYRFYVPSDWKVDTEHSVIGARAADGSNISVVPYLPDFSMNVAEFFDLTVKEFETVLGKNAYCNLSPDPAETVKIDGREALVRHYTLTIGGTTYEYRQYLFIADGMIYNVTYTALPEHFASHQAEVERMLDELIFD